MQHTETQFTCSACGMGFNSREEMAQHGRAEHADGAGSLFRCDTCGTEFSSRAELQEHGRQQHGG
ncbi:MAG: C2H2-type zinc finger protein [Chloroflexota bacterium]